MGGENKHEAPGTARAARGLQHIGYPEPGDCSLRSSSCRHRLTDASLGRANRSSGFHPQAAWPGRKVRRCGRSEEHTSELQSRLHLVCRLLLEKKKKNNI